MGQVDVLASWEADAARANARMAAIRADRALAYEDRRWDHLEFEQQAAVRRYVDAGRLTWEQRADGKTYVVARGAA